MTKHMTSLCPSATCRVENIDEAGVGVVPSACGVCEGGVGDILTLTAGDWRRSLPLVTLIWPLLPATKGALGSECQSMVRREYL